MKQNPLDYGMRASQCTNLVTKNLFQLMHEKQTNLALSADVTTGKALLELAHQIGPEICVLKTHIDIIEDFDHGLTMQLQQLAKQHRFLIFEDRKFADIGNTVKQQYQGGVYHIADWADIINAHGLPGPAMIKSLAEAAAQKPRGLLLLAEMSSANNLFHRDYTHKTIAMADTFPEFVMGFIAQRKLSPDPRWIYMTPGVQIEEGSDSLGQQYTTPTQAILERESDIIIVGRGILHAHDPVSAAKEYRAAGWNAYTIRAATVRERHNTTQENGQ